jgi:hypothetical protein
MTTVRGMHVLTLLAMVTVMAIDGHGLLLLAGVWLTRSRSWRWSDTIPTPLEPVYVRRSRHLRFARPPNETNWGVPVRLFGGDELGCIERRSRQDFPYLVPRTRQTVASPSRGEGAVAGAPVEDEAAIPVRADASAQGRPVDPSVEADEAAGACEFDGRLSLAYLNGRYLIYARANVADRNARFVQVWGCLGRH